MRGGFASSISLTATSPVASEMRTVEPSALGSTWTFGLPSSFYVVLAVALLLFVMAKFMVAGRWIYAVGGSPDAAKNVGIPVKKVLLAAYIVSGVCAGLGAVVLSGRTAAASGLAS